MRTTGKSPRWSNRDYGFTIDLKSGYWQIPLREDQRKLFGCKWRGVYYEACVLILGVKDAVFAFTQIVKPITRYMKKMGSRVLSYIDDIIQFVQGFVKVGEAHLFLMVTVKRCGF